MFVNHFNFGSLFHKGVCHHSNNAFGQDHFLAFCHLSHLQQVLQNQEASHLQTLFLETFNGLLNSFCNIINYYFLAGFFSAFFSDFFSDFFSTFLSSDFFSDFSIFSSDFTFLTSSFFVLQAIILNACIVA
jgi:hypothetical protein